jgi:hypothetical protein
MKQNHRTMPQTTHSQRFPAWGLDELKSMIITVDSSDRLRWADPLEQISVLYLKTGGAREKLFCPILPSIVYLLLEYPLHSYQARWLDSGEIDKTIYDFSNKAFISNPAHDGSDRAYGVLQPAIAREQNHIEHVYFQVAVARGSLKSQKHSNYTIPYTSRETLWVIRQVLGWQAKYGAAPERVNAVPESRVQNGNHNQAFRPGVCPLFRYPGRKRHSPPSFHQLTYFWGQLSRQWDQQQNNERAGVLKMSKPDGVAIFDLRSLRATIQNYIVPVTR